MAGFKVGQKVFIRRKDIPERHRGKSGRVVAVDGEYITVRPTGAVKEDLLEMYPNEIEVGDAPAAEHYSSSETAKRKGESKC